MKVETELNYIGMLNGYNLYRKIDGSFLAFDSYEQLLFDDEDTFLKWVNDEIEDALI